MKKLALKFLFGMILLLGVTSCGGDDVSEGYYFFTAKVNGLDFKGNAEPLGDNYIYTSVLDGDFDLDQLSAYGEINGKIATISVIWYNEDYWSNEIDLCRYDLGNDCIEGNFNSSLTEFSSSYYESTSGKLIFTKYDTVNDIAEGSIYFTAVDRNDTSDVVEITDGAFRLKID